MRSPNVADQFRPRTGDRVQADLTLLTTYRYLRIGMFGLVALLAASVAVEQARAGCWQTSISAYYYTPVRAIFVGGLVATGFALIVVKGRSPAQDILLNVAGMMAPVVAVVPITGAGTCTSTPQFSPLDDVGQVAPWVAANIDNNILALLVVGGIGLAVAAVLAYRNPVLDDDGRRVWTSGALIGLVGSLVLLAGAGLAFWLWTGFDRWAHYIAAFAMFICLGIVVGVDAWTHHQRRQVARHRMFRDVYGAIAALMALAALVVGVIQWTTGWVYTVLVLEIVELALFAAYWVAQTAEFWSLTPEGMPVDTGPEGPALDLRDGPPASATGSGPGVEAAR